MAELIYSPYIEGTLDAFDKPKESTLIEEGMTISFPYKDSPAVGESDYDSFILRIRNAYDNTKISDALDKIEGKAENGYAVFTIYLKGKNNPTDASNVLTKDDDLLKRIQLGNFYKMQIAYRKGKTVGPFSSVGVAKCTRAGTAEINGFNTKGENMRIPRVEGKYTVNSGDIYEKEYSYRFCLYDEDFQVVNDTDWQVHRYNEENSENDVYIFDDVLKENAIYYLQYSVKTLNGLIVKSQLYSVIEGVYANGSYALTISPAVDKENGCINLTITAVDKDTQKEGTVAGTYLITRADDSDDFASWKEVKVIRTAGELITIQDFLVEQGREYKYGIQQVNHYGVYSERQSNDTVVIADFDYAFISDGDRQLKLKYNSSISSFKDNLLESKTETIGSTYPFIFRNKQVKYKEFSISGLISLKSDEQMFFDIEKEVPRTASVTGYHGNELVTKKVERSLDDETNGKYIYSERQFKLKVLDWLNDGKIKMLRTPTEGNYIVRLMNTSLTPENGLNGVLHNFSTTAYEMASYDDINLQDYGLMDEVGDLTSSSEKIVLTNLVSGVDLATKVINKGFDDDKLIELFSESSSKTRKITQVQIEGVRPGTTFVFEMLLPGKSKTEKRVVRVGITGHYESQIAAGVIKKISLKDTFEFSSATTMTNPYYGKLYYTYNRSAWTLFDNYTGSKLQKTVLTTLSGPNFVGVPITQNDLTKDWYDSKLGQSYNLFDSYFDDKNQFKYWTFLSFRKKIIWELSTKPKSDFLNIRKRTTGVYPDYRYVWLEEEEEKVRYRILGFKEQDDLYHYTNNISTEEDQYYIKVDVLLTKTNSDDTEVKSRTFWWAIGEECDNTIKFYYRNNTNNQWNEEVDATVVIDNPFTINVPDRELLQDTNNIKIVVGNGVAIDCGFDILNMQVVTNEEKVQELAEKLQDSKKKLKNATDNNRRVRTLRAHYDYWKYYEAIKYKLNNEEVEVDLDDL